MYEHSQDWIGLPYGSKVQAKRSKNNNNKKKAPPGWMYIIPPTPEIWTNVLRHRTQILYIADISMIISQLELRPGSVILETGTGSGSLTHSLARAISPTGHVYTFEFHEQRAKAAEQEFKNHGITDVVTLQQRNIEDDGFPTDLAGTADAVFLDLPSPWKAIPSAASCLKPDGVVCGFSPCIEQVQRTAKVMNEHGFRNLRFMEVLMRGYEVQWERVDSDLRLGGGDSEVGEEAGGESGDEKSRKRKIGDGNNGREGRVHPEKFVLARPWAPGKGHTGYLTFARLAVELTTAEEEEGEEEDGGSGGEKGFSGSVGDLEMVETGE
jgi:tRNA (adenine57-N1/adenine58-N1)-methyltransferase catalytic subunit